MDCLTNDRPSSAGVFASAVQFATRQSSFVIRRVSGLLALAVLLGIRASNVFAQSGATPTPHQVVESARKATAYLWGLVILFIVLLMGLYILRMLRRAKQRLLRDSSEPTEYTDAWALHQPPPDLLEPHDRDDVDA